MAQIKYIDAAEGSIFTIVRNAPKALQDHVRHKISGSGGGASKPAQTNTTKTTTKKAK
jgi:hypothetical protein